MRFRLITALLVSALVSCAPKMLPTASGGPPTAYERKVPDRVAILKYREFKLPNHQGAAFSIIVGPDKNLWFNGFGLNRPQFRTIIRMTVNGHFALRKLHCDQATIGALASGPDGYVWANTYESPPPSCHNASSNSYHTFYQIYRISTDLSLKAFDLPKQAFLYPTNLVTIGSSLYFALEELLQKHNSDITRTYIMSISHSGALQKAFAFREKNLDFLNILAAPGQQLWLEDYAGGIHDCSLQGHCAFANSGDPYAGVDAPHPNWIAYSPKDRELYVSNWNTGCVYKFSLSDEGRGKLCRLAFLVTYDAIAYYHGNIWVTNGPDPEGRPLFARISPSGELTQFALPIPNSAYGPTALVKGPDGHLWYLRGDHVGEILSKI